MGSECDSINKCMTIISCWKWQYGLNFIELEDIFAYIVTWHGGPSLHGGDNSKNTLFRKNIKAENAHQTSATGKGIVYCMKSVGALFFYLTYLPLEVIIFMIMHFPIEYSEPC